MSEGVRVGHLYRVPARVLARLSRETITVIIWPDAGLADGGAHIVLPVEAVPPDLRMPNSEFDMILDRRVGAYNSVVRKDEPEPEVDEPAV